MITRPRARLLPALVTPERTPAPAAAAPADPALEATPSEAEEETPAPAAPPPQPVSAWSQATLDQPRTPVRFGEKDKAEVARTLCEGKPVVPGRRGFQCACPSYADMPEDDMRMDVGPFFPGHFTGPGRDEVVVVLRGCDSGAGSSQTYASHAVVRREPEGWKLALFERGALGDCTSILSPSTKVCGREQKIPPHWTFVRCGSPGERAGRLARPAVGN